MAANPDGAEGDEDEWRFSLEDIRERDEDDPERDEDIRERDEDDPERDEDDGGNVAGALSPADEIEAGDIDLENALFVLVGIAIAVGGLAGFVNILP
jgi:hypothetical protein